MGRLTSGLTIHQAKGDEWSLVAVVLTVQDTEAFASGLDHMSHEHRRLYVALARARYHVGRL